MGSHREVMENKARDALSPGEDESELVAELPVQPHRAGHAASFYEGFTLRGIRVLRVEPGSLFCSFRVPPRLTDFSGNLSLGAIANLVDELGGAVIHADGHQMKVSVDMSISYMSPAMLHDELEITARVIGHKGGYSATHVLLMNRSTGDLVAEGRHSLFGNLRSKI